MIEQRYLSFSLLRHIAIAMTGAAIIAGTANAQDPVHRFVTHGRAETVIANLYTCPVAVRNHRVSAVGEITATDGTRIRVPADTIFQKEIHRKSADLFNECNSVTSPERTDVSTLNVDVVEVDDDGDADGEIITGYIVADNYFELYVNGKLVAVDPIPFTPFNSVIVKFRAKRPITYAFKLVDWEEHLGLGMELNAGNPWHAGDGGLVARFSDGTVTDSSWKAQSFYIAPLDSAEQVLERGNVHDTTALGRVHPYAKVPACRDRCYAVHYPMPAGWALPSFDDSRWPRAYEYTDAEVGVTNVAAYTGYRALFAGARWLWTVNLVFDNMVLARTTVR